MGKELGERLQDFFQERLSTRTIYSLVPKVVPEPWMLLEQEGQVIDVTSPIAWAFLEKVRRSKKWQYLWEDQGKADYRDGSKLVVVFGASGAGKDLVCGQIRENFGSDVLHISCDSYYGPFGKLRRDGRPWVFCNNYDHPHAVDWSLLRHQLDLLMSGRKILIPEYDFAVHSRKKGGEQTASPAPVILISGIMAAHMLRERADLIIGVEAPFSTCMERRTRRDVWERGRTEAQCREQIEMTVAPGYRQFVEPYLTEVFCGSLDGSGAEIVLVDNSEEVEDTAQALAVLMSSEYLMAVKKLMGTENGK